MNFKMILRGSYCDIDYSIWSINADMASTSLDGET